MEGALLGLLVVVVAGAETEAEEPKVKVEAARAEEAEAEEEIVVTATRTARPLRDAPGAVTVIGRDEIEETGGADIGDVVAEAEGVEVLRYGGPGSSSSAHLRGTYGVHTLVLVDGRTENSPSLGGADISALSPAFVDRIEVVRGPTSTLYGAGAVGGVIQVFTREIPDETSGEAVLEVGSFGTRSNSLSYGAPSDAGGALIGIHGFHADGHRDNSEYDLTDIFCKLRLESPEAGQVLVTAGFKDSRAGWPGPEPAPLDADRSETQRVFGNDDVSSLVDFGESSRSHLQAEYLREGFRVRASFEQRLDDAHQERQQWDFGDSSYHHMVDENSFNTAVPEFEMSASWPPEGVYRLHAGAAYRYDRFEVDSTLNDLDAPSTTRSGRVDDRQTRSAWAQLEAGETWQGVLGIRWDEPSDYEAEPSARVLGAWTDPSGVRVEAAFGTAFRAPSLNDLYWPSDGWSEGNPDLQPETAREAELAVKWSPPGEKARARAAFFWKSVNDLIVWAPDASGVWRPENLNEVEIWGAELAGSVNLGWGFRGRFAYTFLDARETGPRTVHVDYSSPDPYTSAEVTRDLAYTPEHRLNLGLEWSMERLKAGASVSLVSDVLQYYEDWVEVVPATEYDVFYREKELSAHWLVGFRLGWSWDKGEVFLRVENLFDEEYSTQFGYTLEDGDYPMRPRRSVFVGTKVEF